MGSQCGGETSHGVSGKPAVCTYQVTAKRWAHGWELHIAGVGVTQSRTLREAEMMVRDYLRLDGVTGDYAVRITPEVGDGLDEATRAARRAVKEAARSQARAGAMSRDAARRLKAKGLTGRDVAVVLGVSEQRVSQLLRHSSG